MLGKNVKEIISKLKEKMQLASKDENYEIALEIKKQIEIIENSFEKQKVDLIKKHDQDIIALIENNIENKSIIVILNISKGTITSKKDYTFETYENLLEEFIKMYYSNNTIPSEIIINQKLSDEEKSIVNYLEKLSSHKVEIIKPQKGEKLELVKLAENTNKILMVGHILQYHPAIIKLKELISSGGLGKIQYIYSNRLNIGKLRTEENILWSFAPHDISIIQYLLEHKPINIDAYGASFLQNKIEDTTLTYLRYPDNIHAHIFVSWLHPFKEHRLVVIGNKGMIVFEDSLSQDKLKFYPKGFTKINQMLTKFEGDFETINFCNHSPLMEEQRHFFNCIINNKEPLTNGNHALDVLKILEEAQKKAFVSVGGGAMLKLIADGTLPTIEVLN